MYAKFPLSVTLLLVPLLLISAASRASQQAHPVHRAPRHTATLHDEDVRQAAIAQYHRWQGTRYLWGGTTHRGVDCSALMQKLVSPLSGIRLPRTTSEQITLGKRITRTSLRPGDLVFFRTSPRQHHVGLYIGHNEFINSSSSKGVIISTLSNPYWNAHYLTARRLPVLWHDLPVGSMLAKNDVHAGENVRA